MDTGVGRRVEHSLDRAESRADVVHVHRPARVHHVDASSAVALHQLGLPGQPFGRLHVAHHQEAHRVHAQFAGVLDVLARHVGLGAVGGHADDAGTGVVGVLQIVEGADPWQQQRGDPGVADRVGGCFDPFEVGVGTETVVETGALQAIAMGDFDGVHLGPVQGAGDGVHVIQRILMTDGVHAIAQGHVGDVEFLAVHARGPIACAIRSAVASAAEVMMSRLPA
ncbi:hypothetical protein D3C76_1198310 [compost metagenome]